MPEHDEELRLYASFVGPLLGYYAKIPGARTEGEARHMLNGDRRMKYLWMSMYTHAEVLDGIKQFGGQIIVIKHLDAPYYDIGSET